MSPPPQSSPLSPLLQTPSNDQQRCRRRRYHIIGADVAAGTTTTMGDAAVATSIGADVAAADANANDALLLPVQPDSLMTCFFTKCVGLNLGNVSMAQ